jgi:hypothetical protein
LGGDCDVGRDGLHATEKVREELLRVVPFVRRLRPPKYSSSRIGGQSDHLTFVAEEQNYLVGLIVRVPSQSGLNHEHRPE